MDFRSVKRGDPLTISAEQWNAMLQTVAQVRGSGGNKTPSAPAKQRNSGVVMVKNTSGSALERFRSVKIVGPAILPADNEAEFKNKLVLDATTPDGDSAGLWCVTQEQIPNGGFGEAVISGITLARINLSDAEHVNVEAAASSTILASGESGTGQIVWVLGGVGAASATGEQWAIIRLPTGGGGGESIEPGQYQHMVYSTGADNSLVWDFPRLHEVF